MELHVGVARDTRVRRPTRGIRANKVFHNLPVEELLEIQREVRETHPVRRVPGKEHRIWRAARTASPFPVVQPEGNRDDVVSGVLEQERRDRRIHTTAHSSDDARATILSPAKAAGVSLDEHLPGLPVPMVLQRLVQGVEDERKRVLFTRRQRPTQRFLEIRLGHPRRLRQTSVPNELRERRACRDARSTAVDFVANLFKVVLLDANGKASDVAACRVAGLPNAARRIQLACVTGPDEVFYDPRMVVVSH